MKTPYQILNVLVDATDTDIRQAYLQQVKLNPPDKNQQQFQLIHQAYINIKDLKSRLSYELFNLPDLDFDEMLDQALVVGTDHKMTAEQFMALFQASVDDSTAQNALSSVEKP